jgi:hypothetical protein
MIDILIKRMGNVETAVGWIIQQGSETTGNLHGKANKIHALIR